MSTGPLSGVKVVELAGIGPGPMICMLLADMGAEVVRIGRSGKADPAERFDTPLRHRRRVSLDLKQEQDKATALDLIALADILVEGYRPGVTERLGLGPTACHERNPGLVYVRMTGWGQDGPLAHVAGHDLNYLSLTGALHAFGGRGLPPKAPINLMADYAGGALYAAMGAIAALFEARQSGLGQVVDAAMVDGVASLMAKQYGWLSGGLREPVGGVNLLDGGAYFYDVYQCADGLWLSVGCIEPQFYAELLRLLGFERDALPAQDDSKSWDEARAVLAARFRTRTRDEWASMLASSDACVAPVLTMLEAPDHPHMQARGTFVRLGDVVQPAPAPRFSRTPSRAPALPDAQEEDGQSIVSQWCARNAAAEPQSPELQSL